MARKLIPGTDLASRFPAVAEEWDYEKNHPLTPDQVAAFSNKKAWWKCTKGHSWPASVSHRSKGNNCPYCAGRLPIVGETDLVTVNPSLAKEWDFEKNRPFTPKSVTAFSAKKVWWRCNSRHSWTASVSHRSRGNNCPYCAGRLPIVGETDLATVNPSLAKEWNYKKNHPLTPKDVTASSGKKVWWICGYGHSWPARVDHRLRGSNCPYCVRRLPIVGETDLATVNPSLAKEWNYKKNHPLTPKDVTASSGKKVWWICAHSHSWLARIDQRSRGSNCPYCTKKLPIEGKTDLATVKPALVIEWDYERNHPLTPKNVTAFSHKKVWWKCTAGHSWPAIVASRSKGHDCPYCTGQLPIVGKTDLASTNPILAKEWDYEKNHPLTPKDVTTSSGKKVWWKCIAGHNWSTSVNHRSQGRDCPYCTGQLPIEGKTDLETVNPGLTREWDYEKNKPLMPKDVTASSGKKVWWKCQYGHRWKAYIYSRAEGVGCPKCRYIKE